VTPGIIAVFVGYTIGSYGVVLLRDYDIPWSRWINPLNPWQWPAKGSKIPKVPAGRVFPGGKIPPG
jgi:hypothetical protein